MRIVDSAITPNQYSIFEGNDRIVTFNTFGFRGRGGAMFQIHLPVKAWIVKQMIIASGKSCFIQDNTEWPNGDITLSPGRYKTGRMATDMHYGDVYASEDYFQTEVQDWEWSIKFKEGIEL